MKTRTVVLVALAVLLAGGGVALLLTHSQAEAPDEGAKVAGTNKAKAKAAKAVNDSTGDVVVARFGFSVKE